MSNWQIFGTRKCPETRKTERFFKERGLKYQFIDFKETKISKGELSSVRKSVALKDLIDMQGSEYQKRNLKYMVHDIETELLEHPLLFVTPIVRQGQRSTVGFQPEVWKQWLSS
jgi:arsenate reductase (glutaredoxin)